MNTTFLTQYSLWWLVPIFLIAAGLVIWQYLHRKSKSSLSKKQNWLLAAIRFFVYLILLVLLLDPKLQYTKEIRKKPLLIFAQDNSASIKSTRDSSYYLSEYPKRIEALLSDLGKKYDIQNLSFGRKIEGNLQMDFSEKSTNYATLFTYLQTNFDDTDNVQLVIASDGLYNSGLNPQYVSEKLDFPIHTLQLGDTTLYKDVSLYSIQANEIGFINQKLPVKIGIKLNHKGITNLKMEISDKSGVIVRDDIEAKSNSNYIEKIYWIQPDKAGLEKYRIRVYSDFKEYSLKNNKGDFVVDVLNSKRKVSICFDQYHPDLAALKEAILQNSNFDCELVDVSKESVDFSKSNLIVMYQLPSLNNKSAPLFKEITKKQLPLLMILGGNSNLQALNQLQLGITIHQKENLFQDARFELNKQFSLFKSQEFGQQMLESFPPIVVPFADFQFNTEHQILAYQNVKGISTKVPLIAFNQSNNQDIAWVMGEGIWRWKLTEFLKSDSQENFYLLVNRMVQFLAVNEKKSRLIVKHPKAFTEGEGIQFKAELYNQSFQMVTTSNLQLTITDQQGKSYQYPFEKEEKSYRLNINYLPQGNYSYKVSTQDLDEERSQKGEFIVHADNIETRNLRANSLLLKQISKNTSGQYYQRNEIERLQKELLENSGSKPTILYETKYDSILNLPYLLILTIILMILEWFLLKVWLGK